VVREGRVERVEREEREICINVNVQSRVIVDKMEFVIVSIANVNITNI